MNAFCIAMHTLWRSEITCNFPKRLIWFSELLSGHLILWSNRTYFEARLSPHSQAFMKNMGGKKRKFPKLHFRSKCHFNLTKFQSSVKRGQFLLFLIDTLFFRKIVRPRVLSRGFFYMWSTGDLSSCSLPNSLSP